MLEKWKQRAIQMNYKKAILIFLVVSFILVLGFSAALYGNFKDRTDQWKSAVKTSREYQNEEKGDEQDDRNDFGRKDYEKKTFWQKRGNGVRTDMERSVFINRRYCTYSRLRYNRRRACNMVLAALYDMGIPQI